MPRRTGRPKGTRDAYLSAAQQRALLYDLRHRADAGDVLAAGVLLALSAMWPKNQRGNGDERHVS